MAVAILLSPLFVTFILLHLFIVIASSFFAVFFRFPCSRTYLSKVFLSKSHGHALLPFSAYLVMLFPNPNFFTLSHNFPAYSSTPPRLNTVAL